MARKPIYSLRRTVATLAGAGLTGLSAWYTWQHYHDVSAPIAAVVGAGMFHLVETCWRDRSPFRALLFLGLGLLAASITRCSTHLITTTSGRLTTARMIKVNPTPIGKPKTATKNNFSKIEPEIAGRPALSLMAC